MNPKLFFVKLSVLSAVNISWQVQPISKFV